MRVNIYIPDVLWDEYEEVRNPDSISEGPSRIMQDALREFIEGKGDDSE